LHTALVTSSIREHTLAVLQNISRHANSGADVAALFDVTVFGDDVERLKPALFDSEITESSSPVATARPRSAAFGSWTEDGPPPHQWQTGRR
jgi:hypothetical protein